MSTLYLIRTCQDIVYAFEVTGFIFRNFGKTRLAYCSIQMPFTLIFSNLLQFCALTPIILQVSFCESLAVLENGYFTPYFQNPRTLSFVEFLILKMKYVWLTDLPCLHKSHKGRFLPQTLWSLSSHFQNQCWNCFSFFSPVALLDLAYPWKKTCNSITLKHAIQI